MVTMKLFTAEDLAAMGSDAPYELIHGRLRPAPLRFAESSRLGVRVGAALFAFVEREDLGVLTGADGGFILTRDPDTVIAPAVGFVRVDSIPAGFDFQDYFPGPPDLAVEVAPVGNELRDIAERIRLYFVAGGTLVWEVRPISRTIVVYRSGRQPKVLRAGNVLEGEDVLPGFRLQVGDVFKER